MAEYGSLEEAKLEQLKRLKQLRSEAARVNKGVEQYYSDPVGFARNCIDWRNQDGLTFYQEDILDKLQNKRRVSVRGPHGLGKASAVWTKIPTVNGWSTIGELKIGDEIYDENGDVCRVVAKSPVWTTDTYEVEFADGSVITTHGEHEWNAIDVYNSPKTPKPNRRDIPVSDWRDHWYATKCVTTAHMAEHLRTAGGQLRWRIPTARPLNTPEADLPIDPYIFGYWLGDGTSANPDITVHDDDFPNLEDNLVRAGYECLTPKRDNPKVGRVAFRIKNEKTGSTGGVAVGHLRSLGVLNSKHIPMLYMRASIEQRREIVRGLWDSDGYRQAGGSDEISLSNEKLARDVVELLHTLGLVVRMREGDAKLNGRVVGRRWRIGVRFDFNPYKLSRYDWEPSGSQSSRHTQRTIVDIRRVADAPTQCIEVDSPSHLFLIGESMIPTHNSAISAITVLWFSLTRESSGTDWKVVTTAGAWRQLILDSVSLA